MARVVVVQTGGGGGGTGPPSADGALPPPEHEPTWSGAHWNPSPQSDALLQGSMYFGTQDRIVVVVHGCDAGADCGVEHFWLGGQAGLGGVVPAQFSIVWAKHTIPDAQSVSAVQGSGAHCEIISGLHAGGTQVDPGAQAIAGQGVAMWVT